MFSCAQDVMHCIQGLYVNVNVTVNVNVNVNININK